MDLARKLPRNFSRPCLSKWGSARSHPALPPPFPRDPVNPVRRDPGNSGHPPAVVEIPALPEGSGVPDPAGSTVSGGLVSTPEALRCLPADFARRHRVLPLTIQAGVLRLAVEGRAGESLVEDVRLLTGLEVQCVPVPAADIQERLGEGYQVTVEQMLQGLGQGREVAAESANLHDIEVMANEPTVVNLVNLILATALRERASDIHLVPYESTAELRFRIDGLLQVKPPPPRNLHAALVSRIKIMADMNIAERFMPQDGHIQIHHRGARVDIRVGTMPTKYGESVVMRLLEKHARVQTPEELGLGAERASLLSRLVQKPHGLFLATGPTGSGKTTTLYSILQGIYTPEKKIITIEDPIEYELAGVAQIPVRPSRNFTFATGLRAILRQDPDIVMVGEIRDTETAEIAIRAALTGHQVFSTLHTNDATGAVTRLLDMGVEAFLIASSLEGVLAQRLVRRICPACRAVVPVADPLRDRVQILGGRRLEGLFYAGAGCEECRGTGYRGRVGIFELLPIGSELRDSILRRESNAGLKALAQRSMVTMHQDALQKASAGLTTLEEIVRVSSGDQLD